MQTDSIGQTGSTRLGSFCTSLLPLKLWYTPFVGALFISVGVAYKERAKERMIALVTRQRQCLHGIVRGVGGVLRCLLLPGCFPRSIFVSIFAQRNERSTKGVLCGTLVQNWLVA